LLVVSELTVYSKAYDSWEDCLGTFMQVMGPERFFKKLPLRLSDFDMNSLTYAQDSRSYMISVARYKLRKADVRFFVEFFVPLLTDLEAKRLLWLKQTREDYSEIKAKKYETLIIQIWELLPIFLRQNSPSLASGFAALLEQLEQMVN